jgi:hypothetical protein
MFLNELCVSQESGQLKCTSVNSEGTDNESPEMSRMLRLQDVRRKTYYNMLAPSVKERNLWLKCLEQACNEFLENEKCHLQRQQSSKCDDVFVHNTLHCNLFPAQPTLVVLICIDILRSVHMVCCIPIYTEEFFL